MGSTAGSRRWDGDEHGGSDGNRESEKSDWQGRRSDSMDLSEPNRLGGTRQCLFPVAR